MCGLELERWMALAPVWAEIDRMARPPERLVSNQRRQRRTLEQAWSKQVRFIPRPAVSMLADGSAVLQRTAESALVRDPAGAVRWRKSAAVVAWLAPPNDSMFHDSSANTAGTRQIYRRQVVACAGPVGELVPPLSRKRRRDDEPTHRCVVVGPTDDLDGLVELFGDPGVRGLYDDHRIWSDPAGLVTVVFVERESGVDSVVVPALDRLPHSAVPEVSLETDCACDVTLAIDSLDFAGPALAKNHAGMSFKQRLALRPRPGSTRYAVVELAGDPLHTWEAVASSVGGRRSAHQLATFSAGVERALGHADLYVQHKPSLELATQLMDAALWLGRDARADRARVDQARALTRQALLDGFFVRVVS